MGSIASAVTGGIGSIAGGVIASGASKKAAKINAKTQADNRAFAQNMYDQGKATITPWIDRSTKANSYIDGLLGLGGDKTGADNAWSAFRDSSGYKFQLDQAQNATLGNAAARGAFQSGATAQALQNNAIQAANTSSQQYINNLTGVSNQGLSATNALLGQNTELTQNVIGANNSQASSSAANALAQGAIWNKTIDNVTSSLGSSFGGKK